MIEYEDIKDTLINKSFNIYKKITKVENEDFNLKYVNKNKFHKLIFSNIENKIKDWINSLNNDLEIKNLEKLPDYSFIHYISKTTYPDDYAPEVGLINLDEYKLEKYNIDKEDYISKVGEFCFDNCYEEILHEVFDFDIDDKKTKLIDKTEMLKEFENKAFMDYYSIVEKWEYIYTNEIYLVEKAFLIALGQATYEIIFKSIKKPF